MEFVTVKTVNIPRIKVFTSILNPVNAATKYGIFLMLSEDVNNKVRNFIIFIVFMWLRTFSLTRSDTYRLRCFTIGCEWIGRSGQGTQMGEEKRSINTLNLKCARKIPLGRPSHRWKEDVKLDLKETGGGVWAQFICLTVGAPQGISWVVR